jgi:hypothetical protein
LKRPWKDLLPRPFRSPDVCPAPPLFLQHDRDLARIAPFRGDDDLAGAFTGETLYVDCGYNIMEF